MNKHTDSSRIDTALTVVFSDAMVAPAQGRTSPSAAKPALVVADWRDAGLAIRVVPPEPVTVDDLALAHDREYVEDVLALRASNGFGTRSRQVAESLPYTTGAMLTAARLALREGGAVCAPCSGFHHAGWGHGAGFCTFNGLMVTACALLRDGLARRVGIVDCDEHFGDGTEDIVDKLRLEGCVHHFTAGREFTRASQAAAFFGRLEVELDALQGCDVVLYQAGADPHVDDPLGGWLTTEQLRARDAQVFEGLQARGIPVAWNLAGGYQRDATGGIGPVLEIHRNTAREHLRVFGPGSALRERTGSYRSSCA